MDGARERERMHITEIELVFIELPDLPCSGVADMNNGYLLSMWDCTCRLVRWNAEQRTFEDQGGQLNALAIRSWAALPKPLDYPTWGQRIVEAALAKDGTYVRAGWLEPLYLMAVRT